MAVINTNVKSLLAQDSLNINNRKLSTAMQRLSTGSRINSASDDAAGLAISTRMDAQVRGLNMAIKNANDAISVTQTAEGAMDEVTNILQRMRELAVQSANDSNSAEDRKFLNLEVQQLSQEIDRISGTTQFNGINVLDGSYKDKIFQIGANRGQTVGINIGSMNSKVLGVSSGSTDSSSSTSSTSTVGGASVKGTAPTQTVVSLGFSANSATTDVTYAFNLTDNVTGLTASISGANLDITNEISKQAFADKINEALADAQANTTVKGSSTPAGAGTVNLNDPANYSKVKFSISVGGGETKDIDLTQRLMSTSGVDAGSVTETNIVAAMNAELKLAFDDNISVGTSGGMLTVSDEHGRRLEVSQGSGNGYLFGTDTVNGGAVVARATQQNSLHAAWEGNNLMVTNSAGGKVSLSGYSASNSSQVIFNVVDDGQMDSPNTHDPVVLAANGATVAAMPTASFTGKVQSSEIAIRFSDLTGNGTSAQYSFKLTNGDGDVYADLTANGGLDAFKGKSASDIVAAVKTALNTGITALAASGDHSFSASEFDVSYSGDTLVIKNVSGRALSVENFTSDAGYATVTPMNELSHSEVLSSKNAHTSESRIKVNMGAIGSMSVISNMQVSLDGIQNSVDIAFTVDTTIQSGASLAAALQTVINQATAVPVLAANGSITANYQDPSNIKVTWDSDKGELVIRDTSGRSVGFGYGSASPLAGTGQFLLSDYTTGLANKGIAVDSASGVAQGNVYEATRVDMTFNADDTKFNFSVNGTALTAAGSYVTWNANENFQNSTLKTALDATMTSLNADHPGTTFEYAVSGRTITFYQRDGGPLNISDFKTPTTHKDVAATLTPAAGQGNASTLKFDLQTIAQSATASGTMGVATEATLNLQGDDVYSMTISDGTKSYTMNKTAVDISDAHSTEQFVRSLEKALSGSSISVSMDTDGNVKFKRDDGGQVLLQNFTSSTGTKASWTPKAGQGDAQSLDGTGAVAGSETSTTTSGTTSTSGGSSVAQITIATQDGASKALDVIDKALSYVNLERSKLGAMQNRLTHTIDNLSNVVTNTSASRSRIKDTDYATETAELARTQIIQQAATAMLAQANQAPQSVLSLLK